MLARVREQVTGVLSHIEIRVQRPEEAEMTRTAPKVQALHPEPVPALAEAGAAAPNDPTPAGSRHQTSRGRSRQSRDLGRRLAQRPLPLRFRPEVQVLSRQDGAGGSA